MHKRSLLIGVGIGIIIGALLLQLFNLGADSQKQLDQISNEINDTTLDRASAKPEITPQDNVVDDKVEGEELESTPSNTTGIETDIETDKEAQQPTAATPVAEEQPDPEVTEKVTEPDVQATEHAIQYVLRVHPGATVNKTAQLLVDYNIIEDTVSFAKLLKDRDTAIRAGYFLIEEESTDEQVRKLLSGIPLSEKERKNYINVEKLTLIE
ncbi:hypothetical protein [Paenibacillus endoradicis]|uniref:hypothetical protein n=1 Tax=Paenibacillus endoradicis TaxID=2972487 RepID=UPI0021595377|nr:hypothetical protein [Paenibacillus endoradicis]MCR8656281.1 hypothetical protein [Paenibacillus endoradicis]